MLVDAWRHLEGRIRVAIMNGRPLLGADDDVVGYPHSPIIDAIEKGELSAAVSIVDEHMSAAASHFEHPAPAVSAST